MGIKQATINMRAFRKESREAADEVERIAAAVADAAAAARLSAPATVILGPNGQPAASVGGSGVPVSAGIGAGRVSSSGRSGGGGGGSRSGGTTSGGGGGKAEATARMLGFPGGWIADLLVRLGLPVSALNYLAVYQIFALAETHGYQIDQNPVVMVAAIAEMASKIQGQINSSSMLSMSSRSSGGGGGGGGTGRTRFPGAPNYSYVNTVGGGSATRTTGASSASGSSTASASGAAVVDAPGVAKAVVESGAKVVSALERLERKIDRNDGGAGLRQKGLI